MRARKRLGTGRRCWCGRLAGEWVTFYGDGPDFFRGPVCHDHRSLDSWPDELVLQLLGRIGQAGGAPAN